MRDETLSEAIQNQVIEHLREYLADLQDEQMGDDLVQLGKPNH